MTNEEILAMEAGRELDAVIDKEIFGGDGCVHDLYWVDPEEYACAKCHKQFCSPEPYAYSTGISAAWQVVEKMLDLGFCIELYAPKPLATRWSALYVTNVSRHQTDKVYAPKAPEAICKAALMAKLANEG